MDTIQVLILRMFTAFPEIRERVLVRVLVHSLEGIFGVRQSPSMIYTGVRRTDGVDLDEAHRKSKGNFGWIRCNVMDGEWIVETIVNRGIWNGCWILFEELGHWDRRLLSEESLDSCRIIRSIVGWVEDDFVAGAVKGNWEDMGFFIWK